MELSRRSFLRGLLTVAAASIAPLDELSADVPKIVGDGVHDDTAGILAAINGQPFQADGLVVRGQREIHFGAGTFRTTAPLHFTKGNYVGVWGAPDHKTKIIGDHDGPVILVDGEAGIHGGGFDIHVGTGQNSVGIQYNSADWPEQNVYFTNPSH